MLIERTAIATWAGGLKKGRGIASVGSGVLTASPITYASRFENEEGANPEEFIAAAQAACFSMALSAILEEKGVKPKRVSTTATITMEKDRNGFAITAMHLAVEGEVEGIDEFDFEEAAHQAKEECPVSKLLRPGLASLTLDAKLVGEELLARER